MALLKLQKAGGTWQRMLDEWSRQCEQYGETLENYAIASLPVLEALAGNPEQRAGVYAVESDGEIGAICQLNCTPLPGYPSPVLRVRMLTVSPKYDFGDLTISEYGDLLVDAFGGVFEMSFSEPMTAKYINFHLRSPSDRPFFQAIGHGLERTTAFEAVKMAGSWLYVTKK